MIFIILIALYILFGWMLSLLIERYQKDKVFSVEWYDDRPPRFLFVMLWPIGALVYTICCIYIWVDNSGHYDKLVKKIRGF